MTRPLAGPVDTACDAAVRGAAAWFEQQGHLVEESHPEALEAWAGDDAGMVIWGVNMQANLARMGQMIGRELGEADMEPATWGLVQLTRDVTGLRLAQAQAAQHRLRRDAAAWWERYDLLLTPTSAIAPPPLGDLVAREGDPLRALVRSSPLATFTAPWNATGQPAVSLPFAMSSTGLPIGIQLVGAYAREDLLLRVAAAMESDLRWDLRRAGVHASVA
jgi:amidase